MNGRLVILVAICFTSSAICDAQAAGQPYSKNKEANAYYITALRYIKIGNPRTGGSVDSLVIAVQYLEKAVNTDTLFATAYIELCKTYWLFDFSYPNFPKYNSSALVILPKAKAAIAKALKIDSTSSEAYSQLARMNKNYEYHWDEALKNYAKAIQYDSGSAINYASYGDALALQGKWEESWKWIDKAIKMAPIDGRILVIAGIYYYWKRAYDSADVYFSKIPPGWTKIFFSGMNDVANNKTDKAVEELNTLYPDIEQYDGGSKAMLAYALIKNGQIEKGKKILKRIEELNEVVEYRSAVCYVALGDYDKAFALLEAYYNRRGNWMIWLKYDKAWDPVRNDKRYQALLAKMPFDR